MLILKNIKARQRFPSSNQHYKLNIKHYKNIRKAVAFALRKLEEMSAMSFQGGVILRAFVLDSGLGTYAMLTAMVIIP